MDSLESLDAVRQPEPIAFSLHKAVPDTLRPALPQRLGTPVRRRVRQEVEQAMRDKELEGQRKRCGSEVDLQRFHEITQQRVAQALHAARPAERRVEHGGLRALAGEERAECAG